MLSLLWVGRPDNEIPDPSLALASGVNVLGACDLEAATRLLADRATPPVQLIVLGDAAGGEFSDASLAPIRQLAPLARIWRLLGTWCEGEARSGRPPQGCLRTYWHQWPARIGRELERCERAENPAWSLPLTATPDERIAADVSTRPVKDGGTIVIVASQSQAAAALADLCQAAGYETLVAPTGARFQVRHAAAIVWDAEVEHLADAQSVAELAACAPGAPIVATVGFPRAEDVEQARRLGIRAVVSKPYLAGDLLWHLERLAIAPA